MRQPIRSQPVALLVPFLFLAGCGSEPPTPADGGFPVGVIGPVWTVDDADLVAVMDVKDDGDGGIWVLSAHPPFLRSYDEEGQLRWSVGRAGQGPAEFAIPTALLAPAGGEGVEVLDGERGRILHFGSDGELVGAQSVERQPAIPHEFRTAMFGEMGRGWRLSAGVIQDRLPEGMGSISPWDFWRGRLLLHPADGGDPRHLPRFADLGGVEVEEPTGPSPPRLLAAGPLFDLCPSGEFVLHTGARSELVWFDLEGTVTHRASVSLPLAANSMETMVEWLTGISELLDPGPMDTREALRERSRMVAQMSEPHMERYLPPTRLRCDGEGRVWIQLFDMTDDERGYSRRWSVVDRSGSITHEVTFPPGFSPLTFGREHILGTLRDPLGAERAAWVPLPELP